MANSLGPELLAYFALAQVYALIFNDLFNVQTWESLIKFGAKRDAQEVLASTIKTNLAIDIVSALIAFGFAYTLTPVIGGLLGWDDDLIATAALYCLVIPFTLTTFTIGIPRLFNKFLIIAKIQFLSALIKLTIITYLSVEGGDVLAFTAAYIATEIFVYVCLAVYSLMLLRRKQVLKWRTTPFKLTRDQFKFLWWTNLRTIVRIPVRQLDLIIINQVMSLETVGIYKAYKEVAGIVSRLGEPINQAVYPEFAKLLGHNNSKDTVRVTRTLMLLLSGLALVTLAGFYIAAEPMISLLFGEDYLVYLWAFYALILLYCINLFLTPINSLFIAAGFAKYSFYIVLGNNILYLSIALLGGLYFGLYGIIAAFAAQMIFNQGLKLIVLMRHSNDWSDTIR